jgi:carbamoyl-phosphate synthase large subunit
VVVKIPRWPFDKFKTVDKRLGTSMESTGEVMAIGRSFEEALQKAIRSLDIGRFGLIGDGKDKDYSDEEIEDILKNPTDERIFVIAKALEKGWSVERIAELTNIDEFFIKKIKNIVDMKKELEKLKEDGEFMNIKLSIKVEKL